MTQRSKEHYRGYATDAFRLYAVEGSAHQYKKRLCDKIELEIKRGSKQKFGSSVESEVMKIQEAKDAMLDKVKATIWDLEAVEVAIARLELSCNGSKKIKAVEIVYMDADDDIKASVHKAELTIPASGRMIYIWLSEARRLFAEERGLRT